MRAVREGRGLVAVMLVYVLRWWMISSPCATFCPGLPCGSRVGHQVEAVPHLDALLSLRVLAAMRALCMRLVVVARERESEPWALMRHSSLVRVDLESDGMPVKVMAAFGALPAMIDAWSKREAAPP